MADLTCKSLSVPASKGVVKRSSALAGPMGASEAGDRLIVERFARGDASAFEELVANHYAQVARLTQRLLGWREDAEDVVQEVFIAAYQHLHRFKGDSSLGTWLVAITVNQCRSHQRKWLVRLKLVRRLMSLAPGQAAPARSNEEQDEVARQVRDAVGRLPPRDREMIVLHHLEEMSVERMAQVLSVKRNAVEVRLHRARQRLKALLPKGIGEER